jgi:hypothetical protein
MKLALIIILGVFAVICNATQDEIRFRWDRLYGHWFPAGSKAAQWFNPSLSWTNKWLYDHRITRWLFSVPLVFLTDFWHLLKFLIITCIFVIVLLAADFNWSLLDYFLMVIFLHLIWGVIFEGFFTGIYGSLSDRVKKDKPNFVPFE